MSSHGDLSTKKQLSCNSWKSILKHTCGVHNFRRVKTCQAHPTHCNVKMMVRRILTVLPLIVLSWVPMVSGDSCGLCPPNATGYTGPSSSLADFVPPLGDGSTCLELYSNVTTNGTECDDLIQSYRTECCCAEIIGDCSELSCCDGPEQPSELTCANITSSGPSLCISPDLENRLGRGPSDSLEVPTFCSEQNQNGARCGGGRTRRMGVRGATTDVQD